MSKGLTLPAGSPMVQFEVLREAHGSAKHTQKKPWVCPKGPVFHAPATKDKSGVNFGNTYACLCVGRFIE